MNNKIKNAKNKLIKDTILKTAKEIIEQEGIESLSIRKLAANVGYSPANIYQYYNSKAEIVRSVIQQGYKNIQSSIQTEKTDFLSVEKEIRYRFKKYIKSALENKDYYKAVMLSEEDDILKQTSILNPEFKRNSSPLNFLENLLEKGKENGEFHFVDPQKTAQIIWTASFGLIIRLIIEQINEKNVQSQLIESHFEIIFDGIKKK